MGIICIALWLISQAGHVEAAGGGWLIFMPAGSNISFSALWENMSYSDVTDMYRHQHIFELMQNNEIFRSPLMDRMDELQVNSVELVIFNENLGFMGAYAVESTGDFFDADVSYAVNDNGNVLLQEFDAPWGPSVYLYNTSNQMAVMSLQLNSGIAGLHGEQFIVSVNEAADEFNDAVNVGCFQVIPDAGLNVSALSPVFECTIRCLTETGCTHVGLYWDGSRNEHMCLELASKPTIPSVGCDDSTIEGCAGNMCIMYDIAPPLYVNAEVYEVENSLSDSLQLMKPENTDKTTRVWTLGSDQVIDHSDPLFVVGVQVQTNTGTFTLMYSLDECQAVLSNPNDAHVEYIIHTDGTIRTFDAGSYHILAPTKFRCLYFNSTEQLENTMVKLILVGGELLLAQYIGIYGEWNNGSELNCDPKSVYINQETGKLYIPIQQCGTSPIKKMCKVNNSSNSVHNKVFNDIGNTSSTCEGVRNICGSEMSVVVTSINEPTFMPLTSTESPYSLRDFLLENVVYYLYHFRLETMTKYFKSFRVQDIPKKSTASHFTACETYLNPCKVNELMDQTELIPDEFIRIPEWKLEPDFVNSGIFTPNEFKLAIRARSNDSLNTWIKHIEIASSVELHLDTFVTMDCLYSAGGPRNMTYTYELVNATILENYQTFTVDIESSLKSEQYFCIADIMIKLLPVKSNSVNMEVYGVLARVKGCIVRTDLPLSELCTEQDLLENGELDVILRRHPRKLLASNALRPGGGGLSVQDFPTDEYINITLHDSLDIIVTQVVITGRLLGAKVLFAGVTSYGHPHVDTVNGNKLEYMFNGVMGKIVYITGILPEAGSNPVITVAIFACNFSTTEQDSKSVSSMASTIASSTTTTTKTSTTTSTTTTTSVQPTQSSLSTIQPTHSSPPTVQSPESSTPTVQPTQSSMPSVQPTQSSVPTVQPTQSIQPTQSSSHTVQPTQSIQPTPASSHTVQPTQSNQTTVQPTKSSPPTNQPTKSYPPSGQPNDDHPPPEQVCLCSNVTIIVTEEELEEAIAVLQEKLTVPAKTTSSFKRTKTSAPDKRVSSKVIGTAGAVTMALVGLLVVAMDIGHIINAFNFVKALFGFGAS